MTTTQHLIAQAEQRCKSNGTRLTDKRKQVLAGLLNSKTALSAYELVEYCRTEYNMAIPAMSVYRILDFLQDERLVHKLNLANKYVACSHITSDEHDHGVPQFLICGECQRVEEITVSSSIIEALKSNVAEAGFSLVTPQIEMNCLCDACKSNQQSPEP